MTLNHQDIQSILKILDDSPYDELRLDNAEFSLYLKRSADGWTQQQVTAKGAEPLALASGTGAVAAASGASAGDGLRAIEPVASEAGLLDVRAPMVGTFYRSPQPGAAPFIEIGSAVSPTTLIGIIEVMKLMSSIPAQVSGTVREILVEDAQLVEKGQLLLRVKP
jgi:acetyl-CoA carboxylase biotin carboxyl carrier protein